MTNTPHLTFLIIDDDEVFNRTLSRALSRQGKHTFSATNSQQALSCVKHHELDCVILDLNLLTESGIDLIKPLLRLQPSLRIVVLTGYSSLTTAVQAIKLGAWNYLAKPVDTQAILNAFNADNNESMPKPIQTASPISLKQMEWEYLQRVLAENNGNITITARQLGMHRRTLQRKLKKKNISSVGNFYE